MQHVSFVDRILNVIIIMGIYGLLGYTELAIQQTNVQFIQDGHSHVPSNSSTPFVVL